MTNQGFLYVTNIDGFDEQEMFRNAKAFHSMPEEVKHKLKWKSHNSENPNIFRGLAPFVDNDASHKELFDMGLPYATVSEEERQFPLQEETPFPTDPKYAALQKYYEE
jgi:isopenicillin N synthase-like dioxygenase